MVCEYGLHEMRCDMDRTYRVRRLGLHLMLEATCYYFVKKFRDMVRCSPCVICRRIQNVSNLGPYEGDFEMCK